MKMHLKSRRHAAEIVTSIMLLIATASAGAATRGASHAAQSRIEPYLMANRQQEIALARTAAPPSVSMHATVLVLGAHGYVIAIKGSNGFVCLDERSWDSPPAAQSTAFWNPAYNTPKCLNATGAQSVLPEYLMKTHWALMGASRGEISERLKAAWADGTLHAPPPGAICYMMSKLGSGVGGPGPWRPHVMFYFPNGQAPDWGANLGGNPILNKVRKHVTVLLVLVPIWSDGSLAPRFK